MPTRIIQPPSKITVIKPDESEEELPFNEFIDYLLANTLWVKDFEHIKAADEVFKAVNSSTGGALELTEQTWEKLKKLVEDPPSPVGYGMAPWAARQCLAYFECIVEAKKKE